MSVEKPTKLHEIWLAWARRSRVINPFYAVQIVRQARNDALEEAALIVCPEPHVEEERECAVVAALIRARKA